MTSKLGGFAIGCCLVGWSTYVAAQEASKIPNGEIKGPYSWTSLIYPGTERDYWLYIPAQYDASQPACVMVVQDGLHRAEQWRLPTLMDELIHGKEMPVTIGIFIDPGVVPAPDEHSEARYNRSFEYDGLGDRYARFVLEEILPAVGKDYALSDDPNDRMIAGASSGAICAFNAAWERPDAFRRVLSTIGTYVGLRGGDTFPTLVRKTEPKPIRVFLQDGRNDLNIFAGDWWMANQTMLRALQWANYDVNYAWGDGGHDSEHSRAIMPDALRWLWRDYPEPIRARPDYSNYRYKILDAGHDWQLVSEGHRVTDGPAINRAGDLFFSDISLNRIHRQDAASGELSVFVKDSPSVTGLMFAADGDLYACQQESRQIVRYDRHGHASVFLNNAPCNDVVTLPQGIYFTDPDNHKVWFVDYDGNRTLIDDQLRFPSGVVASPDRRWLYVSDSHDRFVYSYQIQPDGSVRHRQKFGHLHMPDDPRRSGADGMAVDTQGHLYVTTPLGVQVLDPPGRVHLMIRKPQPGPLSNIVFGGPDLKTMYVTCGDKVYRRQVVARGVISWKGAVRPPKPRL